VVTVDSWLAADQYLTDLLIPADPVFEEVLTANRAAGLPAIDVAPNQGKLLMLLARLSRARTVLEVGTLGGYSTIWLARGLPSGGRVVTLEAEPSHAAVARANFERAGLAEQVELHLGPALQTLPDLVRDGVGPFDLVFIDADKPNYPQYLHWALMLTRPGSLIIADNVVRDGQVADPDSPDDRVRGVRAYLEMVAADSRLDATALQTVGSKGWDGFCLAVVGEAADR